MFMLQLKWSEPQEEKLVEFMCGEKSFSEDRIRNGIKKLTKARNTTTQGRLDSFFKVLPSPTTNANKRKVHLSVCIYLVVLYRVRAGLIVSCLHISIYLTYP